MELKHKVKRKLWKSIFKNAKLSYSQGGEDMILNTIFCNINNGFYVDIGANNPFEQSNTCFFYKKGWKGLNVDAMPGSKAIFDKARPRDINIEAAINNTEIDLPYYMFKSSFYNTFNQNQIDKIKQFTSLTTITTVKTTLLSKLFDRLNIVNIDFLSIDVEGMDLNVLQSNDWEKWRPKIIITEFFSEDITKILQDSIYKYLSSKNYIYLCNSLSNAFYIENTYYIERFLK